MNFDTDLYPRRFATYEDAMKFMETGDKSLCVQPWKLAPWRFGFDKWVRSSAYDEAPWEQQFVRVDDVLKIMVPSSNTNSDMREEFRRAATLQEVRELEVYYRNHTPHTHSEPSLVRCGRPTLLP